MNYLNNLLNGTESLYLLEDDNDSSNNSVEATVTIRSISDKQKDNDSDIAESTVETIEDAGAELFFDLQKLYTFCTLINDKVLDKSMYEFINQNNQLSKLLKVKLPATESLSSTGSNAKLANTIVTKLDKMTQTNLRTNIKNCFSKLSESLDKLEDTTNEVVDSRLKYISKLIAKLENEEVSAEIKITTNSNKNNEPDIEDIPSNVSTLPEDEEPENDSKENEDTNKSDDKKSEDAPIEINTPDEETATMKALGILNLTKTPIVTKLDAACSGNTKALSEVVNFVSNVITAVYTNRTKASEQRTLRISKQSLLNALYTYRQILQKWNTRNMLHHACRNLTQKGLECNVSNIKSIKNTFPIYKTMSTTSTYLRTTKKALDTTFYNLQYLSIKFLNSKKYR